MKSLGRHLLVDYYGCNSTVLNDPNLLEKHLKCAVMKSGATIIESTFRTFEPYGVSGIIIIAESHFAIHTWPEYNFASIDFFTCGVDVNPYYADSYLKTVLSPEKIEIKEIARGIFSDRQFDNYHPSIHANNTKEKKVV